MCENLKKLIDSVVVQELLKSKCVEVTAMLDPGTQQSILSECIVITGGDDLFEEQFENWGTDDSSAPDAMKLEWELNDWLTQKYNL